MQSPPGCDKNARAVQRLRKSRWMYGQELYGPNKLNESDMILYIRKDT